MMQVIADLWEKIVVACSTTLTSIIRTFGWNDLLDIVIVSYLIYKLIQIVRETRAAQLVKGIILLLVAVEQYFPMGNFSVDCYLSAGVAACAGKGRTDQGGQL